MNLPKKDSEGIPYISYSQANLWNELKGFNTGKLGKYEYIRRYFLGERFEDNSGFGEFGQDVENYITERTCAEKFSQEEKERLEKIQPLHTFQYEIKLQFPEDGFYLLGYIDDMTEDRKHIRDYKTASENSSKKYYKDDYKQLDLYALAIKQDYGFVPERMEVLCIERLGNGFRGGRNVMTVGERVWSIERETSPERLEELRLYILNTAKEIAAYWEVFCLLNKIIK